MGRRKGPDQNKLRKIIEVLKQNPQGLWIREIARQAKLSKSTVHRYVTEFMESQIEEVLTVKGGLVKIVKLKK
jgi:response regulator of citrate/malate metabolism